MGICGRLAVCLLLAGCAGSIESPRHYYSYRELLIDQTKQRFYPGPFVTAPYEVKQAYSECGAEYVLSGFTPTEKARLDAFAQQKTTLSAQEARNLDNAVQSRLGGDLSYENLDRLSSVCPDKVPLFKQYLKR
jgi:hypothetical protein